MLPSNAPRLNTPADPPPPVSRVLEPTAFAAHGIWAPGVILMRNLRFAPKMMLLMTFMVAALAAVAFAYYSTMLGNIAFSAKERDGVRYLRAVYPALLASLDARRDAAARAAGNAGAPLDASTQALQAALKALEAEDAALGAELNSGQAFQAVRQAASDASVVNDNVTATFDRYTRTSRALIDLAAHVCDTSNLTLDPEVHSYYVMDVVCFRLPDMMERTGALRGAGNAALLSGVLESRTATAMAKAEAIVEFHLTAATQGLAKTIAERPDSAGLIRVADAQQPTAVFLKRFNDSVLQADTLDASQASALVSTGNAALQGQRELTDRLLPLLDAQLDERVTAMEREMIVRSVVIVILVLAAAYFGYGFFLVNHGGSRLIQDHLGLMAEGDLREPPPKPWGQDESAQIIGDMRITYDSLHALIRKVRHAARDLASASQEIAHASRDLGSRTEEAAATLEEQASAMEEIGSQVGGTAQRAHEAADFSQRNAALAASSRTVIDSVVGNMRDIQGSSQKIADIIGVIDGIAFQTNILALNAAVEAARAGEAGRGFAVVAGEVRALAQRSAEAARQIKALIDESVTKVQSGVTVVEQAGGTMGTLVQNAETINGFMVEISTAAREQASGVEQSVQSIQQLDASTQQNAALVEETSAAASALEQQAQRLMDEIARFRL